MDALPPVFSGTLKVRACHFLWTKTPVQLTYLHQDFRHAMPVLLIRRSGILGGEFRIPLDPCIHPVRLLPVTKRTASKLEFALEYGWHTNQVRLRAPNANTYREWTSVVRAALESGRRPLASCDNAISTSAEALQDSECSSLASTMNSSNNGSSRANATVQRRTPVSEEEEQDEAVGIQHHFDRDHGPRWQPPSQFFVLHHADCHPFARHSYAQDAALRHPSCPLSPTSSSNAAVGNCSCDDPQREEGDEYPTKGRWRLWSSLRSRSSFRIDWASIIHELFLQASVWYWLL